MAKNTKRIIQLMPTLSYGDGVGNDALALDKILKEQGYSTKIYAENIDSRVKKGLAEKLGKMPKLNKKDVILYHLSTGTELNEKLKDYPGKKIVVYHNVTPAHFFKPYSNASVRLCEEGRKGIRYLKDVADYCLADSDYNKYELEECGYQCKIDTLPILIPFEDYEKQPSKEVINKYNDDWTNIVFVGRVAPNKKQEDIIKTFYYYKKYINPKSRLFLVGSYSGLERYYNRLNKYVEELELEDVYFTGHTKFDEILAYYRIADVFLCMSEHEGFCIPLVEAMYFKVPIVAYSYTGVKETLSYAGLKLEEKDCKVAVEMINLLVENKELRENVIEVQNKRLGDFAYEKVRQSFIDYLKGFLK